MQIRYRFDKVYGLAGFVFGIFLITLGCITVFRSWSGIILITIGALLAFSVSSNVIDVKHYRICFAFELLGFIRIGNWMYIPPDMELLLTDVRKPCIVKCASKRVVDVSDAQYLIILIDTKRKKQYLICKTKTKEKAEEEIARLSDLLDICIKYGGNAKNDK
ncbi:MAG: hypothetical protein LBV41_03390 [Cytophagaceae bacterium]|jgi:hypothetical protein|nr:hypothetical protein [Cytophagaceae bacterium]